MKAHQGIKKNVQSSSSDEVAAGFILASLYFHTRSIRTRGIMIQMQTEAEQVQFDNLFNTKNTYRKGEAGQLELEKQSTTGEQHPEAARKNPDFSFQRKI